MHDSVALKELERGHPVETAGAGETPRWRAGGSHETYQSSLQGIGGKERAALRPQEGHSAELQGRQGLACPPHATHNQ